MAHGMAEDGLTFPGRKGWSEWGRQGRRRTGRGEREELVAHAVCVCVCARARAASLSCVGLFATPWTVAHQAPLSRNFPGKNTAAGCHFLFQGIFPGISLIDLYRICRESALLTSSWRFYNALTLSLYAHFYPGSRDTPAW